SKLYRDSISTNSAMCVRLISIQSVVLSWKSSSSSAGEVRSEGIRSSNLRHRIKLKSCENLQEQLVRLETRR
ncbi:hypothetical protein AVEN_192925-1, partial [Araneus ventricosus]